MPMTPAERKALQKARKENGIMVIRDVLITPEHRDGLEKAGYLLFTDSEDKAKVRDALELMLNDLDDEI